MLSRSLVATCSWHTRCFARTLATEVEILPLASTSTDPLPPPKKTPRPTISAAVILNRSPLITRSPSTFERAYYSYQARLRRALHNPFPYDFYFKEGSILETRFNVEERKRERHAFGPLFGIDDDVDQEKAKAARAAAAQLAEQEGEFEEMVPRLHPSDVSQDTKSLDRKGKRNIYLLLKTLQDVWRFPQGGIEKNELLHQAAQRDLYTECGQHMDSWIVSRNPVGVYKPPVPSIPGQFIRPEITFFFKAHIMAGQVRPGEGVCDFAWLTKQEIEGKVEKNYWDGIKDILSDY
ncbi:39S mitochondrial ribosomal protein L46-domain-containing protein [Armillaria fumosa]|nr:39S mitochondrial ribosomal protein L46-domain-containing protein [Armillaria fumosa]